MPPQLEQGRIIYATVEDRRGQRRKTRPLVIVSETNDIVEGQPFYCVAISSTFATPLPDDHVLLPSGRGRGQHPRTLLTRECAAVCKWLEKITTEDVESVGGILAGGPLRDVIQKVARFAPIPKSNPPEEPSVS